MARSNRTVDGRKAYRSIWPRLPAARAAVIVFFAVFVSTASVSTAATETSATARPVAVDSQSLTAVPTTPVKSPVPVPVIANARVTTTPDRTTLTLSASAPVSIDAFALSAPYRVVIDTAEARFDLAGLVPDPRGLIHAWRAGVFATGRSRIVLDTSGPVRISGARVEPTGDGRAEIIIELQTVSATTFEATEKARLQAKAALAKPAPVTNPAGKGDREPPRPDAGLHKMIVVLDPGHGGLDAGTVSPHTGMPEKQVVLEFSRLLEKKLTDTGRYEVYLTRTTDTFVPLGDRVKFARSHHADLLVSIHADAELDRSVRGSTIFTLSEKASDAQAAALAIKENQSDALAGIASDDKADNVADILVDLIKREAHSFSHALAEMLVNAMSRSGHMVKMQPHRSASLRVLKAYDVPSVLIELGFLSNKDDESELVSPKWRDQTATAIVSAIDRFFASHDAIALP